MLSVAMCTYNGEKYIEEQLNSILNQTMPIDEIIVCDDKSTDQTVKIVERTLAGKNVNYKIVINQENLGVSKNFEKALSLCKGDIIFLSDQDDIWLENKVEIIFSQLLKDKNALLAFTDAYLVDKEKKEMKKSLWDAVNFNYEKELTIDAFLEKRFVTGATVALRRELLDLALPIPESWIHDAWLAIVAGINGNVLAINEKTILYRQHENNVIGAQTKSIITKIVNRVKSIEKSILFRTTMKNRFSDLLDREIDNLNIEQIRKIKDCYLFWSDSSELDKMNFGRALNTIWNNSREGKYKKYNHGKYGLLIDLYIIMTKRIRA